MDASRLDSLARTLAQPHSRRRVIAGLAAGALALVGNHDTSTATSSGRLGRCRRDSLGNGTVNTNCWVVNEVGGPSLAETNGQTEIALPAGSAGDPFFASLLSTGRLSGNFDVVVDFDLLEWSDDNGVRVGITTDSPTPLSVQRTGDGGLYLTHFEDGITAVTTSDVGGALRLTRTGSVGAGYYRAGRRWVLIHKGPVSTADVRYELASWGHGVAVQDTVIAFDNFRVQHGRLVG